LFIVVSFIAFILMGLGLWCLTPLPTIYRGSHFHWLRKPENPEKTTDLYRLDLAMSEIRAHIVRGDMQWLHI